jgi:hypothetical protein
MGQHFSFIGKKRKMDAKETADVDHKCGYSNGDVSAAQAPPLGDEGREMRTRADDLRMMFGR